MWIAIMGPWKLLPVLAALQSAKYLYGILAPQDDQRDAWNKSLKTFEARTARTHARARPPKSVNRFDPEQATDNLRHL
jgi:hypothetical protein